MMKLTIVTLGIFLAITFVQGVDLPWVNLEFITEISRQKVPEQVIQGVDAKEFISQFINLIGPAIARSTESYYEQVYLGINAVKVKLTNLTDSITATTQEDPEDNMKIVNKLLQDVMEVMPANVTIGPPPLPDLPPPVGVFDGEFHLKTSQDILENYPSIVEGDLTTIRKFMDHLYMIGWSKARNFYTLDQNSLKKAYKRIVVPFFLEKLEKIEAAADNVRDKVSPAVWDDFTRLGQALKSAKNS